MNSLNWSLEPPRMPGFYFVWDGKQFDVCSVCLANNAFADYMKAALDKLDAATDGDEEAQAELVGEALGLSSDEVKGLLEAKQED